MTPTQREAALRLIAEHPTLFMNDLPDWCDDAFHLLRELLAEQRGEPVAGLEAWKDTAAQAQRNADFYRGLVDECAKHLGPRAFTADDGTVMPDPVRLRVPELVRELLAEPQGEPVAWRSKTRINGDFDSGWHLTSTEPPQTPRTIAIEPLFAHPPQQRKPLTDEQIDRLDTQAIHGGPDSQYAFRFARLIERAILGEAP